MVLVVEFLFFCVFLVLYLLGRGVRAERGTWLVELVR